jgi:hypothetical protein
MYQSQTALTTMSMTMMSSPGHFDVLFGRGKAFQKHPGNRRMLKIVQQYKDNYQKARREAKDLILQDIIVVIQDCGRHQQCRFLKRQSSDKNAPWCEASEREVRSKVAHVLRDKKSNLIKQIWTTPNDKVISSRFEPEGAAIDLEEGKTRNGLTHHHHNYVREADYEYEVQTEEEFFVPIKSSWEPEWSSGDAALLLANLYDPETPITTPITSRELVMEENETCPLPPHYVGAEQDLRYALEDMLRILGLAEQGHPSNNKCSTGTGPRCDLVPEHGLQSSLFEPTRIFC